MHLFRLDLETSQSKTKLAGQLGVDSKFLFVFVSKPTQQKPKTHRDYFMVGECVRFLFTSCEGSLNERISAANE